MRHLLIALLTITALTSQGLAQEDVTEYLPENPESSPESNSNTEEAQAIKPEPSRDQMQVILKPKETPNEVKTAKKSASKATKQKTAAKKKAQPLPSTVNSPQSRPDAETSLRYLINGNSRFAKKNLRADGRTPEDRMKGLNGETPHTAILASSDSRVVPEIIFDQGLGEIYTTRVFGESLDPSVVASLEYAVAKLNVPLLVVLGNSDCAAMKVLSTPDQAELSPSMTAVTEAIRPRLKTLKNDEPSPSYEVEATLNADAVARELARRSPIIRKAVETGKLTIKSGLYRINTGRVTFY